jgi:hypothetical protein
MLNRHLRRLNLMLTASSSTWQTMGGRRSMPDHLRMCTVDYNHQKMPKVRVCHTMSIGWPHFALPSGPWL